MTWLIREYATGHEFGRPWANHVDRITNCNRWDKTSRVSSFRCSWATWDTRCLHSSRVEPDEPLHRLITALHTAATMSSEAGYAVYLKMLEDYPHIQEEQA